MRPEVLRNEMKKLMRRNPSKVREILSDLNLISKEDSRTSDQTTVRILPDILPLPNEISAFQNSLITEFFSPNEVKLSDITIMPSKDEFILKVPNNVFNKIKTMYYADPDADNLIPELRLKQDYYSLHIAGPFESAKILWNKHFNKEENFQRFLEIWSEYKSYNEINDFIQRNSIIILKKFIKENDISLFELGIRIYNVSTKFTNILRRPIDQSDPQYTKRVLQQSIGKVCFMFPMDNLTLDLIRMRKDNKITIFGEILNSLEPKKLLINIDNYDNIEKDVIERKIDPQAIVFWLISFLIAKVIMEED